MLKSIIICLLIIICVIVASAQSILPTFNNKYGNRTYLFHPIGNSTNVYPYYILAKDAIKHTIVLQRVYDAKLGNKQFNEDDTITMAYYTGHERAFYNLLKSQKRLENVFVDTLWMDSLCSATAQLQQKGVIKIIKTVICPLVFSHSII